MKTQKVEVGNREITVDIADNFLTRSWGLSFRKQGKMLFKFSEPTKARIDMMLLSKPLWLYFLDENKRVIDIQKAEPWTSNPKTWKLYSPDCKYRYLLESFEELEVKEGDQIKFS
ncbi:MAG: uncharacterized membrane protein (UPF0127 family) [Candidatus Nanohaloarchaea archaeon]|jgi:uncharacterized membrane protein (UPF0127 family)